MTFIDTLKKEHGTIKDLFQKVQSEAGHKTRPFEQHWTKLCSELMGHMEGEEKTIYPALMDTDAKELALSAIEEHSAVKMVINQLCDVSYDDEHWKPKLKLAKDLVEHHISEEEGEILPKAVKLFDAKQLEQFHKEFTGIRKETMAIYR